MYTFNLAEFNTQRPSLFIPSLPQAISPAPESCIVVVLLRDRKAVGCLVRELNTDWIDLIEDVTSGAQATDGNEILITVHAPRIGEELVIAGQVKDSMAVFLQSGIHLLDAFQVTQDRYWSYFCVSSECCDPAGELIDAATGEPSEVPNSEVQPEVISEDIIAKAAATLPINAYDVAKTVWTQLNRLCEEELTAEQTDFFRACIMISVQEVQIRDYVLGEIAHANGEKARLAEELAAIAYLTPQPLRGRVAGMAAGAVAATGGSVEKVTELVQLAEDDSLARLIDMAIRREMPISGVLQVFSHARDLVEQNLLETR